MRPRPFAVAALLLGVSCACATPARAEPADGVPVSTTHSREYRDPSITTFRSVTPAHAGSNPGRRMYLEVGQLWSTESDGALETGGLRWGSVTPFRPSGDFALTFGLVPALVTNADLDLAVPIEVAPRVRVIPRAGVSGLALLGGDFAGFAFGLNAGGGLVLNADGPMLLRVDYTERLYLPQDAEAAMLLHHVSAGLGWRF